MATHTYSVETIRRYLLEQLPESEIERLDELSIVDDECAELVRAVEYELSDAFVRGELHGTELEHFRSRYLTTSRGREATRFAEALQSLDNRLEQSASPEQFRSERRHARAPWTRWLLVAAVVVLATASAWQAFDNRTLRTRVASAESDREALQRARQLREDESRRAADTAQRSTGSSQVPLAVLVLATELRGASRLPTLALSGSTGDLAVQLDLEPVDYPAYRAALLTSTGSREVWRSAEQLTTRSIGSRKTIDLRLPATVLSPQDYVIRVSGVTTRGALEIVGDYRFAVVK